MRIIEGESNKFAGNEKLKEALVVVTLCSTFILLLLFSFFFSFFFLSCELKPS